jgi:hypothetical protein
MNQKYQGDISVIQLTENQLPKSLKFKKLEKDLIVAYGEATGHTHRVKVKEPETLEFGQDKNGIFIKAKKQTTLEHNVHGEIDILPGITFIGHQVEYDEAEEIRRVQD